MDQRKGCKKSAAKKKTVERGTHIKGKLSLKTLYGKEKRSEENRKKAGGKKGNTLLVTMWWVGGAEREAKIWEATRRPQHGELGRHFKSVLIRGGRRQTGEKRENQGE